MKKVEITSINRAEPNWRHRAFGIRCSADWAYARVYKFSDEVGGIIALNTAHAWTRHCEVLEGMEDEERVMEAQEEMFE